LRRPRSQSLPDRRPLTIRRRIAPSRRSIRLHDPANCFCRAQGKTFAVGETACLRTGEGPRVAECGMVLNNTSWQFTARPCPES
jgi:hypothetical protein